MDQIIVKDLEVYAGHGVFPEENRNGQIFVISAVLYLDLRPAGKKDELTSSTHYGEVCQFIKQYLKQHTFQLIEAAAEHVTEELLFAFPRIREIELELKKPDAPIGLPFAYVSVKIRRGWKRAYIGIGSNMGNKQEYITKAIQKIRENVRMKNIKVSDLIITPPYGGVEQDDFLNGVIEIETLLHPLELLDFLHELENDAKRVRTIHWGPRTLDLDILDYEDYQSYDRNLTVPHPDMANRSFVLEPLMQLEPFYRHPITGKNITQMLKEAKES